MSDILDQIEYALRSDSDAKRDEALDAAYVEIERLRSAIGVLHRVWWSGPDVDKTAVTNACLSLFVAAEQSRPAVSAPGGSNG